MTMEELFKLAGTPGVGIGPHTVTHRRLTTLWPQLARTEVLDSVSWLRNEGLQVVDFFAYPFGQTGDVSALISGSVRGLGLIPLTTVPGLVNGVTRRVFEQIGFPRLSVGPAEVSVLNKVLRILPLVSNFPRTWLFLLGLRRKVMAWRAE
jgi:peptidoglycan/xylan/chitin deacetylase (PgdA/CDA1 family)